MAPPSRKTIAKCVRPQDEIRNYHYNLDQIIEITGDGDKLLEFLAQNHLITNSANCQNGHSMNLHRNKSLSARYEWNCPICCTNKSALAESFFNGARLPPKKVVQLMYWWADINCKQSVVADQVGVSTMSIVLWYNYLRDVCAMWSIDHPMDLGGPGKLIELDESKIMKREHKDGKFSENNIILRMIERKSLNVALVPVKDCLTSTLLPIISMHVRPDSTIITDSCKDFQKFADDNIANHKLTFIHPNDPSCREKTKKSTLDRLRSKYKDMHRPRNDLYSTYLYEYIWREHHKENTFMNLIYWISYYYEV